MRGVCQHSHVIRYLNKTAFDAVISSPNDIIYLCANLEPCNYLRTEKYPWLLFLVPRFDVLRLFSEYTRYANQNFFVLYIVFSTSSTYDVIRALLHQPKGKVWFNVWT